MIYLMLITILVMLLNKKGDVEGALLQYQAVKTIVAKDEKM